MPIARIPWSQTDFARAKKKGLATVIGRHLDNDDILVALLDGSYVNVHLTGVFQTRGHSRINIPHGLHSGR